MTNIKNEHLEQMIRAIPNPQQRRSFADIISGKITHEIHCLSKACKNRLIGYVYQSGRVEIVPSKGESGEDVYWLRSSRDRLDGYKGFECWCGNDSRLAEAEKESFDYMGTAPTKEGLEKVYDKLQRKPAKYPSNAGKQVVDGFAIIEV